MGAQRELATLDVEIGDRALAALVLENGLLGYDVILHRTGYRPRRVDLSIGRSGVPIRVENLEHRRNDFHRRARKGKP